MKTENDCRCDKRINQLEEALRSIVNGDMRLSKTMARCALEGAPPAVDEKPEQEAESHVNVFAVHDASGKNVGHFEVDERANKEPVGATAETPWEVKEGYWYEQYQLMRERYNRQIGKNTQQAERIRELEEQRKEELETEQAKSRELYAMLGHIVDWSPQLPFYIKDEYKVLFKNALAAARELLSKCSVKGGK